MRRFKHGPEELEMMAFFDYANISSNAHPAWRLAFHIPNERKASIQRRITLARCGVKKGMPDICVPVSNHKYNSLFIEMKVKPNKPSPAQIDMLKNLMAQDNYTCICWSADEAIAIVKKYINDEL